MNRLLRLLLVAWPALLLALAASACRCVDVEWNEVIHRPVSGVTRIRLEVNGGQLSPDERAVVRHAFVEGLSRRGFDVTGDVDPARAARRSVAPDEAVLKVTVARYESTRVDDDDVEPHVHIVAELQDHDEVGRRTVIWSGSAEYGHRGSFMCDLEDGGHPHRGLLDRVAEALVKDFPVRWYDTGGEEDPAVRAGARATVAPTVPR